MKDISEMSYEDILSEEVFIELFDMLDPVKRTRTKQALEERAKELKVSTKFKELYKAYLQIDQEQNKKETEKRTVCTLDNYTNFTGDYDRMACGGWIANDTGIFAQNSGGVEEVACYHPILPVERLKNLETGEEQIKLAYKRNGRWNEIIVPKTMITSANKIVALSGRGISVTSENAKLLVKYLSDVENMNDDYISVQYSTSKLGWIAGDFIPYDREIVFDGDSRFRMTYDSISCVGSEETWMDHIKELRKSGRMEIKMILAASFASVLVKPLGALPFFVDLWGETEGGKTVTLMMGASVWAAPDESRYIGDFKTTDVALEAKADMLNHLPMFLDDTSKTSARIRDNFESVVYDLCSGKGKSRSNKELGINRENHWRNIIICNGERPLSSYVNQGGAINRILEIECGEKVYSDPQKTAETVKHNYGFAGRRFVEIIRRVGIEKIQEIQGEFQSKLMDSDKMQKQAIALSVILTADKLVTDYLFKDGCYISVDDAKAVLIDRNELSDNERCYNFLLDKIAMNPSRFDFETNCEKWGVIENGYAVLYPQALTDLCKQGGFSQKSFRSWGVRTRVIDADAAGKSAKLKKINGRPVRCVFLRLEQNKADADGFMQLDDDEEPVFPGLENNGVTQ